jgi:cyclophilin family peptidyl-prolyl cis-trans isomerase
MIEFKTTLGDFSVELLPTEAPISSDNFQAYVDAGYFDGTIFHRVIPGFMLQGGGFTADMQQKKTNDPIKNEATNGLKNKRGTLSMARTNDINSATSQFFVNLVDMNNEWRASASAENVYEVVDRSSGQAKWTATANDLVFGSHCSCVRWRRCTPRTTAQTN